MPQAQGRVGRRQERFSEALLSLAVRHVLLWRTTTRLGANVTGPGPRVFAVSRSGGLAASWRNRPPASTSE